MTYIAFLRGINVGGKAVLPMRELAALFTEAGATGVRTYVQSGNVLFRSEDASACVAYTTQALAKRFGLPGHIVLRTGVELRAAFAANPFALEDVPETQLHVYFLADWPTPEAAALLDPERSPGDRFVVHGREVYLLLPNGMGRTRLTNGYFDAKLKTVSTARNWRTVSKLVELASS